MKQFLKGQLHLHTTYSDGEGSPQEVLDKYKSCGYDFIVWTDHRINIDVNSNFTDKKGIICIGGIELDCGLRTNQQTNNEDPFNEFGHEASLHCNALGVYDTNMSFNMVEDNVSKTCENIIDEILANGGIPMVNHPNWIVGISYRELLNVNRDYLMEIGNCWDCNIGGNFAKEGMEVVWDILLSNGRKIYGTATDDCHQISDKYIDTYASSYNRGYVGVWAEKNEQSILQALKRGDFYASNGVDLEEYTVNDKSMTVKVKPENDEKYVIVFKGKMGIPLKIVYGTEATYEFTGSPDEAYIRAKVVSSSLKKCPNYVDEHDVYYKACYTQPFFTK